MSHPPLLTSLSCIKVSPDLFWVEILSGCKLTQDSLTCLAPVFFIGGDCPLAIWIDATALLYEKKGKGKGFALFCYSVPK